MAKLKGGLIQMALKAETKNSPQIIKEAMIEAHLPLIEKAGKQGVQVLCFQEVFTQPYFCPSQDAKWYAAAEPIPDGPTTRLMQDLAKKHRMVIVVPIYEEEMTGVYYNTAAVIDADGTYLGKYRKTHIPHVAGLSEYLWKLEQPASAVANGVFIGAINRVGSEGPWNIGEFYGQSYFVNPRGKIEAIASRDKDELLVHEMDFEMIREVRNTWQFFRDRRPETYAPLTALN
ncbi:MAG TPA: nitrilase-related carbon-nitrogen hydrolase [Kiloniellales bacterium]